ncbi:hypothetical protein AFCA_011045 [Aspergillus flavus]|nr:hypothetical protein AFCA_011045 [Aspergillus flavus]
MLLPFNMYDFPPLTYNATESGIGDEQPNYSRLMCQDMFNDQNISVTAIDDIDGTGGTSQTAHPPSRDAAELGQGDRYGLQVTGSTTYDHDSSLAGLIHPESTDQLILRKLLQMEATVNKLEQARKEGVDKTLNERINILAERLDKMDVRVNAFAGIVDELLDLPDKVENLSKWMNDLGNTFQREKEWMNNLMSGVDDACKRFRYLIFGLSQPRGRNRLGNGHEKEQENEG